jgi:hypothetical protein
MIGSVMRRKNLVASLVFIVFGAVALSAKQSSHCISSKLLQIILKLEFKYFSGSMRDGKLSLARIIPVASPCSS